MSTKTETVTFPNGRTLELPVAGRCGCGQFGDWLTPVSGSNRDQPALWAACEDHQTATSRPITGTLLHIYYATARAKRQVGNPPYDAVEA